VLSRPPPYRDYEIDLYSGRRSIDNPCCQHTRHDRLRTLGDGDLSCTLSAGRHRGSVDDVLRAKPILPAHPKKSVGR
jgi:hypothetical protein